MAVGDLPRFERVNSDVRAWMARNRALLNASLRAAGIKDSDTLLKFGVKSRAKLEFGLIDFVEFRFKLSGIWIEKGVGRGHPIESVSGNRAALGGGARTASEWFTRVINDKSVGDISDIVQTELANATARHIRL